MSSARDPRQSSKPTVHFPHVGWLACISVVACLLGIPAGKPMIEARARFAENSAMEHRLKQMERENQELEKSVAALSSPSGMEAEARRLGYVRNNEVTLVIPR